MRTQNMHPDGYHKSEDARSRCWSCSHPELVEMAEEDHVLAATLVAEGWRSTSNSYRTIKRVVVPAFDDAITFTETAPNWLRREVRRLYAQREDRQWARSGEGEERTLTLPQFRAFKKAGGQVA